MSSDQDAAFSERVHQGHVANFLRKVGSAENQEMLQRLHEIIDFAFEKQMIDEAGRDDLYAAIHARQSAMQASQ